MAHSKTQKIIKDTEGNEVVMLRADKTLKEMMEREPQSRWDVKYWHPNYDYLDELTQTATQLKEYLVGSRVISADTIRASRGESYSDKRDKQHPYRYLSVEGIFRYRL